MANPYNALALRSESLPSRGCPWPRVPSPPQSSRATILLAEDHREVRWTQQLLLESQGFAVLACANALEAEALFSAGDGIQLLMTDLDMPGRTGWELAERLTGRKPGLPVMIVSGSQLTGGQVERAQQLGWVFLPKPAAPRKLLHAVKRLVDGVDGRVPAL